MPDQQTEPTRDTGAGSRTVVSKAVAILMSYLYGGHKSFTEIVASTGMPVSTVHRLVWELTACRILERTELGRYRVAPPLRRLAAAGGVAATLESRGSLVLHDLAQTLDTEVRLGVLREHRLTYIETGPGRRPVTAFRDGVTAPVHDTAMGMVLLAFSPRPVVDAALLRALTAADGDGTPSRDHLLRVLHRTRTQHLTVMWNDAEPDRSAIAVPVFKAGGLIAAALEVRVHPSAQVAARPALVVAGRSLTRQLAASRGGVR